MTQTPGLDFATQVILQVHYQSYRYVHCLPEEISSNRFQD